MAKKALEDTKYELIKAHILDKDNSPLNEEQQEMLDRVVCVSKILDKNPVQKNAAAILMEKYQNISRSQAYEDIRMAIRLFNSTHTFEYDLWHTWLLNDIIELIDKAKNQKFKIFNEQGQFVEEIDKPDFKAWSQAQANLIKALGDRPEEEIDPKRNEKQTFYILIQNQKEQLKVPIEKLEEAKDGTISTIIKALHNPITDVEAEEILKS